MDELYAHTPPPGSDEWQSLVAHLRTTAELARAFAGSFGSKENGELAGEIAYRLTLWHDLGKYSDAFQTYLRECYRLYLAGEPQRRRGPDHKAAGAYLATYHFNYHLPLIIQGHHGGLPGQDEFRNWLDDREQKDKEQATGDRIESCLQRAKAEIPDLEPDADLELPDYLVNFDHEYPNSSPIESIYSFEFFIRMIYSCLVDADSLDTEQHINQQQSELRYKRNLLTEQHWQAFAQYHAQLEKQGNEHVSRVQNEVYQACLDAANKDPRFFRLTVPTGGGKTLSGLAFALRHALHLDHKLERVIVAVPFLTITQQTTEEYRKVFAQMQVNEGQPVVLEHFSSADAFKEEQHDESGDPDPHKVWQRLAAENWDAPIIVTTTVQLFESMFARQRSRCRKLHNLAKSVIILDETQSLPAELLCPILDGLRELVEHYGCTVVFSTATQPEFNLINNAQNCPGQSFVIRDHEIVEDFADHFALLQRVEYDWRTDTTCEWSDVASWMVSQPQHQALAIVNTKKDAQSLILAIEEALSRTNQEYIQPLHLSTLLCGAHREQVIEQVSQRLDEGKSCLLVSTQVVEAGVDLDFPLVLRALGPLASIVQAAGRCNRKGKLNDVGQRGKVIIFNPKEGGEPYGVPRLARQVTESLLRRGDLDPNDPAIFADYYKRLFSLIDPDHGKVQEVRRAFDYREVADRFRMIDEDSIALVVRYSSAVEHKARKAELEKIDGWVQDLIDRRGSPRQLLRCLQPYIVNLRRYKALTLRDRLYKGQPIFELIGDETSNIGVWNGEYDEVRGLILPEGLGLDEYVV